jgi:hypothetical protein
VLAALVLLGALGVLVVTTAREQRPDSSPAAGAPAREAGARAYLVATGLFALPPAGREPSEFARAQAAALAAQAPLAHMVWGDQESFETAGWRDLLQVGRVPFNRPPAIDFAREVAVLVWPVAGQAPEAVLKASGLTLRGAAVRHVAVELRVGTWSGGPVPATPAAEGPATPYALASIPRDQWPVPAPPPAVPPVAVALARL